MTTMLRAHVPQPVDPVPAPTPQPEMPPVIDPPSPGDPGRPIITPPDPAESPQRAHRLP